MRLIFLKYSARFCYLPVPRDNTLSRDNVAGVTKYIKVHVRSFLGNENLSKFLN